MLVWDLDGTLIDTREANYQAYRSVGVRPPDDFHVRPWQSWCSQEEHDRKNEVIPHFMRNYARPRDLLYTWEANGRGTILSNISLPALEAVIDCFPILENADIRPETRSVQKAQWLNVRGPGIYFDDSEETINLVRSQTKWTAILVR